MILVVQNSKELDVQRKLFLDSMSLSVSIVKQRTSSHQAIAEALDELQVGIGSPSLIINTSNCLSSYFQVLTITHNISSWTSLWSFLENSSNHEQRLWLKFTTYLLFRKPVSIFVKKLLVLLKELMRTWILTACLKWKRQRKQWFIKPTQKPCTCVTMSVLR